MVMQSADVAFRLFHCSLPSLTHSLSSIFRVSNNSLFMATAHKMLGKQASGEVAVAVHHLLQRVVEAASTQTVTTEEVAASQLPSSQSQPTDSPVTSWGEEFSGSASGASPTKKSKRVRRKKPAKRVIKFNEVGLRAVTSCVRGITER